MFVAITHSMFIAVTQMPTEAIRTFIAFGQFYVAATEAFAAVRQSKWLIEQQWRTNMNASICRVHGQEQI